MYLQKELDLQCLINVDAACKNYSNEVIVNWLCNQLILTDLSSLFEMVKQNSVERILPNTIPQFSSFDDAYSDVVKILAKSGSSMSYDELGTYLANGKGKNVVAQRKYGENHSKLAALLDLTVINLRDYPHQVSLSVLGYVFYKKSKDDQKTLIARLLFRIPIIQQLLKDASNGKVILSDQLYMLAEQTKIRRQPNIAAILQFIYASTSEHDTSLRSALKNIEGWC